MSHLSLETKESIVLKALNRGSATIQSIAETHNIGVSTLQKWLRRHREGHPLSQLKPGIKSSGTLNNEEKFAHLLATSGLDEVSLGQYCREHGLYSHQLKTWREELVHNSDNSNNKTLKAEHQALQTAYKRLEKELSRKEKALAEASALLILKKKADLIWGGDAED